MNTNQLATLEEAVDIKKQLGLFGGGVSNVYVPEYQYFAAPNDGDKKFYHFDFVNGAKGLNVGLIRETIKRNPFTWPAMIAADIAGATSRAE
ncbi:MAG: hypothetical protein HYX27_20535 [Acidobacteria bacterium]|nr:hypothetical protein [Acidobacteriota bacterium]